MKIVIVNKRLSFILLITMLLSSSCFTDGKSDLNNDSIPVPNSTDSVIDQREEILNVDVTNNPSIEVTRKLNCLRSRELSQQASELSFEAMRVQRTDIDLFIQLNSKSAQLNSQSQILRINC
jgi:hypothetical protein